MIKTLGWILEIWGNMSVMGPQVKTKVDPEPDLDPYLFSYRGLNMDSNLVFNGLEHLNSRRIGDPLTSLSEIYLILVLKKLNPMKVIIMVKCLMIFPRALSDVAISKD